MAYDTALRSYTGKRLEEIEKADILVGIPSYNNEKTIVHVLQMVTHGLYKNFQDKKCVILVADGGSTDDTREVAKEFEIKPWQEKIVSIYRGQAGKGTALRSIFEAAVRLKVKGCAVVDSDLRSITSDWIKYLLEPVLERGYQFVAPIYARYKYDGTITNNVVYNVTRALYGKRIRQPIGGDFAFSLDAASAYIKENVWNTDVARYGIDIWMTTQAIIKGLKIAQARLGVKVHDAKDPSESLGPMFRQVIGTLFTLMEQNEWYWKNIQGSMAVEMFGPEDFIEPEPIEVNLEMIVEKFRFGVKEFGPLYRHILSDDCVKEIESARKLSVRKFSISLYAWVLILYELAATFHSWKFNRIKLVEIMTPLYYGRVAAFINQTKKMSSREAERVVEEQAGEFEENKDYLISIWDQKKLESEEINHHLKKVSL
ncbi:MAG TPA: glycosyltransferase [Thermodesulfobacteriota bacterium]|nr:glycosyltransferase [Thermodesulfobacteriota bacterium]